MLYLTVDGGYRHHGAAGAVLVEDNHVVACRSWAFSAVSSVQAEVLAVIDGAAWAMLVAPERIVGALRVYSDNDAAIRQGTWHRHDAVYLASRERGVRRHRLAHQLARVGLDRTPGFERCWDDVPTIKELAYTRIPGEVPPHARPLTRPLFKREPWNAANAPWNIGATRHHAPTTIVGWWRAFLSAWAEIALHHYYATTKGCYSLPGG